MKKSLLSMFAVAAGLLMATSCSNEREEVKTEGEAVVSFTAELPKSLTSRAPKALTEDAATFGDGTTATNLSYAVYKVTEATDGSTTYALIDELSDSKTINISTTVSLKLVNGNRYAVAFWADATTATKASIYTFNKATCTITADYTDVATSDESLDAFYAVTEITVNGSSQEVVELHRPFAQLNIGTGDLADSKAAGQEVLKAGVKVIVPNTLDLKSGEVSGENTVEFALADLPEVTFPVTGYSYLTMNYLLMSEDKQADNTVTISYDNANVPDRVFNNVPLQRNYRTNIYGNLLTSTTDFNVIIKPEFDGEENVEIWDGATTKEPAVENNAYIVKTPSEWAYLCGIQVNKSIELAADLDFGGNELGSINLQGNNLHVDGNGFTIKNVKLVGDNKCNTTLGTYHASLFCSPNNQQGKDTVRNLTVRGAEVICLNEDCQPGNIKGHAAVIFATLEPNAHDITIENVHVIGADIYGIQPVAGIVGRNGSVPVKIDGCSVEDSYLHNVSMANESGFVASIIGRTDNAANVTIVNTVSKNNKIEGYYAPRRGEASIQEIAASGIGVADVTASDNTVIKKSVADAVVSTTEELRAALAAGKSTIELEAGNYTINNSTGLTGDKTISIVGADKEMTVLTLAEATYQEGAKLSFSNVTISSVATDNYDLFFYRGAELNFTNCNINGVLRTTATKTVVDNSIIDNPNEAGGMKGYPIWFYAGNMEIKNSTIKGNTKGILVYSESIVEFNLTIDNCQFINKTDADDKAAIEIHTEHGIYGTLTFNKTTISGFPTSVGAGAGLWNEVVNVEIDKNPYGVKGTQTKRFKVTVDGTVKQEQVL